ncbi:GNAT family N-acetyltransferase [Cognatishimia maritima]|uniref:L-amino acid N-acyltransferase YncA n=1 Tax=Cognatishimia maritima TaxID=870908 RepID=A0A1M5JVA5_9RHOB|nr:GNAT family N-acetyltransferase [Cognatishimia maritima]SHG44486.1 L-amino acid N-acyltransferase YncA [Cognatishimia maritima]
MSFEYSIRPARTADANAITAMMTRSYGELLRADYHPRILEKALPKIGQARPELLGCGTYYVAESAKGRIVGAGGWTDLSPTRGLGHHGEGHMRHVAVDPSYLRRGVGGAIARAAIRSALEQGVHSLRCMSTLTAEVFYRRLGFQSLHAVELALEPGLYFPAIEMRMTL